MCKSCLDHFQISSICNKGHFEGLTVYISKVMFFPCHCTWQLNVIESKYLKILFLTMLKTLLNCLRQSLSAYRKNLLKFILSSFDWSASQFMLFCFDSIRETGIFAKSSSISIDFTLIMTNELWWLTKLFFGKCQTWN